MSYLPELRSSLVRAAARQADVSAPAATRRPERARRRSLRGLALIGASLTALAVAAVALVLVGHRGTQPAVSSSITYGSRKAALESAAQILAAFRPPPGAVAVVKDPSRPRMLGWVDGGLPVPSAVDLTRFYVMHGDPQSVIEKFAVAHLLPSQFLPRDQGPYPGMYGVSSSSSSGMSSATQTVSLVGVGGLARQLVVETATAGRGMSAIRVDAQTWWTVPRPASEQIPGNVRAIAVQPLGPIPKSTVPLHPPGRLVSPSDINPTVAFLNAVDVVQPTTPRCRNATGGVRLRLTFTGTGQHPDPVAIIDTNCDRIALWLRRRPQRDLIFSSSTHDIGALRTLQILEVLMGAPVTRTWAALIADDKRATSTGHAPASSGAAHAGVPQTTSAPAKAP